MAQLGPQGEVPALSSAFAFLSDDSPEHPGAALGLCEHLAPSLFFADPLEEPRLRGTPQDASPNPTGRPHTEQAAVPRPPCKPWSWPGSLMGSLLLSGSPHPLRAPWASTPFQLPSAVQVEKAPHQPRMGLRPPPQLVPLWPSPAFALSLHRFLTGRRPCLIDGSLEDGSLTPVCRCDPSLERWARPGV